MDFKEKIKLVLWNPKNFKNYYLHLRDLRKRSGKKRGEFVSAQIEPTTRCNLACPMCLHAFDKLQKPDMSLEQFKDILDQLPHLANITLQGLGEPLLNPELFSMIKEAKKRKIRVGLTTNATLLNKEKAKNIIESGLDWMYISIDTADKQTYESIRKGAQFENTVDNIRAFVKMEPKLDLGFWTLIMKETVDGVGGVVDLAKDLGIKKMVFQNAIHNWGHEGMKDAAGANKNLEETINVIKRKANGIEIEINVNQNHGEKCNWPWRCLYITSDGFLTPCCMQGSDPEIINFGNIFKTPVKAIVNNQKYQDFRHAIDSEEPPEVCKNCPVYYQQKIIKI